MFLMRGRNKARRSFRIRLTVGLSAIILLIMGVGAAIMIYETVQAIRTSAEARGLAFSRSLAMVGGQAVIENLFLIQEALNQQTKNPDITEIDVIDIDDMIVAAKHPERIGMVLDDEGWRTTRSRGSESLEYHRDVRGGPILVIAEPLVDQGKVSAWIRIVFSLSHMRQEVFFTIGRMVILTVALVAAGIFAMWFALRQMACLLHRIVVQLQEALRSLSGVSNHDLTIKVPTTPEYELEHLADAATSTTELLKTQSDSLRALTVSLDEKVCERTAELDEQRRKAEEASRLKSAFLASLNHELRTPLNGILGMVSMLSDKTALPSQQMEQLQVLRSCAESLKDLIRDVLDLSKIEAGKMELVSISFEPRMTLERIMDILALQAAERGIELVCRTDKALPCHMKGDPQRLQEILLNLTGNALKFTHAGEVEVRTQVVEESADSLLAKFSIRDSGIGIPRDKQELIFEPFMQVTDSSNGRRDGTGLGLAICRRLVELMGGTIGVESELGVGSRFWFTARFEQTKVAEPLSVPIVSELRGARILIVDDNAVCRTMLTEMLEAEGALPQEASDGESSLLALKDAAESNRPFHLVLLDDDMPGLDAACVAKTIRAGSSSGSVLVALMSSVKRPRETEWLHANGFAASLTKPIKRSQFLDTIPRMLRQTFPQAIGPQSEATVTVGFKENRQGGRILLVEDNEANQMVVKWFLHETGYQIDIVSTGQDALRWLERQHYDIVLLDIHLPDLNGETVVEIIRGNALWTNLPILALTAASMPEDIKRLTATNLTGYLVKPLDRDALLSAIENALVAAASRR